MVRSIVVEEGVLVGEPFLEDSRLRVSDVVVKYEELGYCFEDTVKAYPRLSREDIENALDYYYNNKPKSSNSSAVEAV
jgi:uncharacterized protein (DUF433 family)